MNAAHALPRSPELMSRDDSGLLVVDVQDKLLPSIEHQQRMVWNIGRLIDGAHLLRIPVAATEQYPQGLGPTTAALVKKLEEKIPSKLSFSCGSCGQIFRNWQERGIYKVLVAGIETHVCVLQTVMDLLGDGFRTYVAVDAVGSRHTLDYQTALRRMESAGAILTTTETALFEWCAEAGTPEFKQISALVRQAPPGNL